MSQGTVEAEIHAFRYRVVQTFLISGTPLERLKFFRPLLELSVKLTDESHMKSYIPQIEEHEFGRLREELHGQFIGIAFDGTTRLGEAVSITGRFCNERFELVHRLLRLVTTQRHMRAAQLSALVVRVLCTEHGIPPSMVCSISRDSALVNGAACRSLREATFTAAADNLCISHTLNNVGEHLQLDHLKSFMTPWLELVGGSNPHHGAQRLWRETVNGPVPGYSKVRWHSVGEIAIKIAENFNQLPAFIDELDRLNYGDATRTKLRTLIEGDNVCLLLTPPPPPSFLICYPLLLSSICAAGKGPRT